MTDPHRPLKTAFGRFATGVAVAAAPTTGGVAALTINSFASVSLEPPLLLWCLERKASAFAAFMESPVYGISVLRAGQQALSDRYARRADGPRPASEFEMTAGAPLLPDRLAGFSCEVADRHSAGDHEILVVRIVAFDSAEGAPLLYFASRYAEGPAA